MKAKKLSPGDTGIISDAASAADNGAGMRISDGAAASDGAISDGAAISDGNTASNGNAPSDGIAILDGNAIEDGNIIARFNRRDEGAIAEFENRYKKLCVSIARGITGSAETAEECFSDTCLRLWNAIPPAKPVSLRAYAGHIVRNIALNRLERERTRKRSALLVELDEVADAVTDLETGELTALLDSFLETVMPLEAKLFVRRYWYCEPVREIAARLGIGENKASKLLGRTRAALKKYLCERGFAL